MSKELKTSANTGAKEKGIMDKWILKHIDDVRYHMEFLAYDDNLPVRKLPKGFKRALAEQIRKNLDLGLDDFDSTVMNYRSSEFRVFVDDYSGIVVVDVLYPVSGEYFRIGKYYIDSFIYYYQPRSELVALQSEQEHSDVTDTEPQKQEEEPQEQEREERVKYKLTFYYDDGTSVSAFVSDALSSHFISSGDGVVFNLHQSYKVQAAQLMDMGHKNGTVFNVFNFPNADKICTIDVSFLPPDYDDDSDFDDNSLSF